MSTLAERFKTRLPFVVGVTGHRHLDAADEPRIRAEVGRILDDVGKRLGDTPLVMICGMAPGADLICAEAAIARQIALCAVLPLPLAVFEHDFSVAERERLHNTLDAAVETRVLGDQPDQGYLRLAEYIARYSHTVIALWDGAEGGDSGGTADVVRMRVEGLQHDRLAHPGSEISSFPDVGPVVHISTRRTESQEAGELTAYLHPPRFEGDLRAKRDYDAATARLKTFNRDMRRFGIDNDCVPSLHAAVDRMSNVLRSRNLVITAMLYVIGAAAATVHLLDWDIRLRTGLLALGLIAFVIARHFDLESRYQDYRALSGALRVREAWAVSGIAAAVESCYLRMYQSELQWIRMALRTTDLIDPVRVEAPAHPFDGACREWFEEQWGFYRNARAREARRSELTARTNTALFAVGAVCATLAVVFPQLVKSIHGGEIVVFSNWFKGHGQTFFAIAVAYGALLASYLEKRGFATNAKRYEHMFFLFDAVKRRLANLPPEATHEAEAIILELGREALAEHADWLLQRRERPLNFIQG